MIRTLGLFATGAGGSGALFMWALGATGFMEPVAAHQTAALGLAGISAAGVAPLGAAFTAQACAGQGR